MILLLVLCRPGLGEGFPLYSEEATSGNITQPALPKISTYNIPQSVMSRDGDEQGILHAQDENGCKLPTEAADNKDVQSIPADHTTTIKATGGPTKDDPPCQQMKLNEQKTDGNVSSSTVIFTEGSPVSGGTQEHTSPWSHQTKAHSTLVQSVDFLPTFTSQRPTDLPTTVGNRTQSNNRNSSPCEQRYVCDNITYRKKK